MSSASDRIAVFQDTLEWIKADPDLSASIVNGKKFNIS